MADFAKNSLICGKKIADQILTLKDNKLIFDFEKITKIPDRFVNDDTMSREEEIWLADNWGTLSNALDCDVQFSEKENLFTINFQTKWGIPRRIIEKLVDLSKEDNFIWLAIYEPSDLLEIFTKNAQNKLERRGIYNHNIDFYDNRAYDMMKEYLSTESSSKKKINK